jgi:Predicted O-methyltransferase
MKNLEVLNNLLAYEELKIIQRKDMFNFSLDTVLIANFCSIGKDVKKIIDFGTNNAAIPLLLSKRTNNKIVGIEIQKEAYDLAVKNIALNKLENQIEVIHADIKDYIKEGYKKAQLVICNPPFFQVDEKSRLNESEYLKIARHEIKINLEEIISAATKVLENRGKLALVHRPERLVDILELMKKYQIEPKRLRFCYPKLNKASNTLLIEGIYQGNSGLKIEAPLYTHHQDGSYSAEVLKMFGAD